MPFKRKGGGNFITPVSDMNNINNLDYHGQYTDFNYDKYLGNIRQSNIVGGGGKKKFSSKKLHDIMQHLYSDFKSGHPTFIHIFKPHVSGGSAFIVDVSNMNNLSTLNYNNDKFHYDNIQKISSQPYSKFST